MRVCSASAEFACNLLNGSLTPTDLVFSHPDGKPIRPNGVSRAFNIIVQSLGINGARLHDLRHAHASFLLQQGVHPKIVQERLGHSPISKTLDIYSPVLPSLQEAAARRFEEGLEDATIAERRKVPFILDVGKMLADLPRKGDSE